MRALIEAEAPGPERKTKLMASFNRGYSGFQQSYRTCTEAADIAIRRYLDEGAKISARDHRPLYQLVVGKGFSSTALTFPKDGVCSRRLAC